MRESRSGILAFCRKVVSERMGRMDRSPTFLSHQKSCQLPRIRCLDSFKCAGKGVGGQNGITFVWEFWDRALDSQFVTWFQTVDVVRCKTVVVFLDKEGQLSRSVRPRNGCVWSDYWFPLCVLKSLGVGGLDNDAGGERKQRGLVIVQLEDKPGRVTTSVVKVVE